ncbi:MAG: hypothetical protein HUJ91_02190 [Bacteroidales bacterium]|nr:hypothetical protein [Bacteroidales bacterium]
MKKLYTILAIMAAGLLSGSCIETTATYQYMEGTVSFSIPEYIYTGELVELTASGIYEPAEPNYGWVITSIQTDTLLGKSIVVQFPDEPAEYTVKAIAKHNDYISSSTSKLITTVDTARFTGSLLGRSFADQKSFTDPRDGRGYFYEQFGDLDWFTENLAWEGKGSVFADAPVMNHILGRYYTWLEAKESCPAGWRLPTNADWESLSEVICDERMAFDVEWTGAASAVTCDVYFNGERFWPFSVNNSHEAKYAWNPLPCGYRQNNSGQCLCVSEYGMWWSADLSPDNLAYYRYIYWDSDAFCPENTSQDHIALSVRCVRDTQRQ